MTEDINRSLRRDVRVSAFFAMLVFDVALSMKAFPATLSGRPQYRATYSSLCYKIRDPSPLFDLSYTTAPFEILFVAHFVHARLLRYLGSSQQSLPLRSRTVPAKSLDC